MKINIIGVGYIGLPTAAILANNGYNVLGVDINKDHIDNLNNRTFITKEEGLVKLIHEGMDKENLKFSTLVDKANAFIICTPTPLKENKTPDLSLLLKGLYSISSHIEKGNVVIIESTIPPGTINNIIKPIIENLGFIVGEDVFLAYCPERVIPNNIIYELINNPRVIGGVTEKCSQKAQEIYKTFVKGEIYTDIPEVIELVKLVENSYRDVNISFSNEIALVSNKLGVDPYRVIELANKHPRVNILKPGIGVGGHCLPIDSYFIIDNFEDETKVISLARITNDSIPLFIFNKIVRLLKDCENPTIAIWGVTYKGNSDDTRNSPAIEIINLLKGNEYNVNLWDPRVSPYKEIDPLSTIEKADLLMVLVDHKEIIDFNYNDVLYFMRKPIIFDGVNIIDSTKLSKDIVLYKIGNL